jgi:hypothetical protein
MFEASENIELIAIINIIPECMRENVEIVVKESLGYYELKQHKMVDERCSEILQKKKQAMLQRLK